MDGNLTIFLVLVVAISAAMIVTILSTWIRARHRIPGDEELAALMARGGQQGGDVPRLTEQNERLTAEVSRLQERIAVLERIATDPAERTAREIDSLR